jgi:hypothetical protein
MKFIDLPAGFSDTQIMDRFSQLELSGEKPLLVTGARSGFKAEFLLITNFRVIRLKGKDLKLKAPPTLRSDIVEFEVRIKSPLGSLHVAQDNSTPRLFFIFDSVDAAKLARKALETLPAKPPSSRVPIATPEPAQVPPGRRVQNFHPKSSSTSSASSSSLTQPNQVPEPYKSNVDPDFKYSSSPSINDVRLQSVSETKDSTTIDDLRRIQRESAREDFLTSMFKLLFGLIGAVIALWLAWQLIMLIAQLFSGVFSDVSYNEDYGDNGFVCVFRRGCAAIPN